MNQIEKQNFPYLPAPKMDFSHISKNFTLDNFFLKQCLFSYIYIWEKNYNNFWFFPIEMENNNILGYKYSKGKWKMANIHTDNIIDFFNK